MKRIFLASLVLSAAITAPALAALATGATAPGFTLPAALGGKDFTYDLASALKKGPAVVYFYPKAFTSGCTVEAHMFADAMDQFATLRQRFPPDMLRQRAGDFSYAACASRYMAMFKVLAPHRAWAKSA